MRRACSECICLLTLARSHQYDQAAPRLHAARCCANLAPICWKRLSRSSFAETCVSPSRCQLAIHTPNCARRRRRFIPYKACSTARSACLVSGRHAASPPPQTLDTFECRNRSCSSCTSCSCSLLLSRSAAKADSKTFSSSCPPPMMASLNAFPAASLDFWSTVHRLSQIHESIHMPRAHTQRLL